MRVFWLSGLVDRPSDRLYVHTIPLSGCTERRSRYKGEFLCVYVCFPIGCLLIFTQYNGCNGVTTEFGEYFIFEPQLLQYGDDILF